MIKNKPGVYMILNIITNDRYVGSSPRRLSYRWSEHKCQLNANRNNIPNLQSAWNKYGPDAFCFIVLENVSDNILEREQHWINNFKNNGVILYNRCPSAFNNIGLIMPNHVSQISSETHKKRWANMSPKERKYNIRKLRQYWNDRTSKELSDVVKEGWRKRNEKRPPVYFQSPSGDIIAVYHRYNFCLENGLDPSAMTKVIKGKRPSHKGWTLHNP